jgi:rhodanese-related sulfurtransferase
MVSITLIAIVVVAVLGYWIYSTQGNQNVIATTQRLNPQQYQSTLAATDHMLVDVRTPEEFNSGHIAGAVNIALQSLPAQINTLPKDKPIVLYCRSGARSSTAAQMLAKAGYTNVYDLGGLIDWRAAGLPLN